MKRFFVSLAIFALASLACQTVTKLLPVASSGGDSPTPTIPPPSPTPAAALGVPLGGGEWQISLNAARTASALQMGQTTITPKEQYGLLILDVALRHLNLARKATLSLDNFAILDANKTVHTANGGGWGENAICAGCVFIVSQNAGAETLSVSAILLSSSNISFTSTTVRNGDPLSVVFVLEKAKLKEEWTLQFQDAPPIKFRLGDKASYPVKTDVSSQEAYLSQECKAENIKAAQERSGLIYQDWKEKRLTARLISPEGGEPLELCGGFAYNDFETASDGAMLLAAGPLQGWSNFYLIESGGKTFSLARNAAAVDGAFIPASRYVVFSVNPLGENKEDLYLYDRDSGKATLLYEGMWINYRVFSNGALLAEGTRMGDLKTFAYMGFVGAGALPELNLPQGARSGDITSDGEHLLNADYQSGESRLYLSNLSGGERKEVKADFISYAGKQLSSDGKYLLLQTEGTKANSKRAALYDFASHSALNFTPDSDDLQFSFSPDGKWAVAVSSFNREESDKAKTRKQIMFLFNVSDKKVVKETAGEIVNYFFSPDGAFFAYTLMKEDETLEMFVVNLSDGSQRSLGSGVLTLWSR